MTSSVSHSARSAPSPPFPFSVESVPGPRGTLVRVGGELDLYTTPALADELMRAIRTKRPVVVDLTAVELLDSTALAALVKAGRRVSAEAHPVRIVCGSVPIRKIFEVTGTDRYFRICASLDEAFSG